MSELDVRVLNLEPMRVASVRAFGAQPEEAAWKMLAAWAGPKGLLDDPSGHPVFGFNNPNPTAGQTEYGYELWIKVGSDVTADGEIEIKAFESARRLSAALNAELVLCYAYLPGDRGGSPKEVEEEAPEPAKPPAISSMPAPPPRYSRVPAALWTSCDGEPETGPAVTQGLLSTSKGEPSGAKSPPAPKVMSIPSASAITGKR